MNFDRLPEQTSIGPHGATMERTSQRSLNQSIIENQSENYLDLDAIGEQTLKTYEPRS